MTRTLRKSKARSANGSYVQLPHSVFLCEAYTTLSAHAVKLLVDLFIQFNGKNNGDYDVAWKKMQNRGWSSKTLLYRAIRELEDTGWIIKTREGGKHKCSLYAITWLPVNECDGKLDISPTRVAAGTWKHGYEN